MWRKRSTLFVKWLCITILVTSIGNAGWEFLIGPVIGWLGSLLLKAVAAAPDVVTNALYREVATAKYSNAASIIGWYTFILTAGYLYVEYRLRRDIQAIAWNRRRFGPVDPKGILSVRVRRLRALTRAMALVIVPVVIGQVAIDFFCVRQEALFAQRVQAVSEFISVEDERVLRSRFARVGTERAYVDLMSQLDRIAADNGVPWPRYKF